MPAKINGRPGIWEAEAIQDLFRSKTLRDSFKQMRSSKAAYTSLCEYMNEPSSDGKSAQLLNASIVFYLNSCDGSYETKILRGKIGGLSYEFLLYSMKIVPDGTSLRSLLARVFEKHRTETGCVAVGGKADQGLGAPNQNLFLGG